MNERAESLALETAIGGLLERERYSELESVIASFRKNKRSLSSPTREITCFYSSMTGSGGFPGDDNILRHVQRLQFWYREKPRSSAVRVVIARTMMVLLENPRLYDAASAYQDSYPWLRDPAGVAERMLSEAAATGDRDPEIYSTWIRLMRVTGGSEDRVIELWEKANSIDSTYFAPSGQYAKYLAQYEREPDGWWRAVKQDVFLPMIDSAYLKGERARLPFDRIRNGFKKLEKQYPNSTAVKNMYCKTSLRMRDREVAAELFQQLGEQYDPTVWTLEEFHNERDRILGRDWKPQDDTPFELADLHALSRKPTALRSTLCVQLEGLWDAERFAELDVVGETFWKKDSRFENGQSKFDVMLLVLSKANGELERNVNFQRLRRWNKEHPDSKLARTLLIEHYISKAWKSRGSGWAYSVTKSGWAGFEKNLGEAAEIIAASVKSGEDMPALFYTNAITVGMGAGLDREVVEKFFDLALERDPHYIRAYSAMSLYLLPRWHGAPGEWESFAEEQIKKRGAFTYYYLYLNAADMDDRIGLSKKKAQAGALDAVRSRTTNYQFNEIAAYTMNSQFKEATGAACKRIGDQWEPWAFKTGRMYRQVRAWALFGGDYPTRAF